MTDQHTYSMKQNGCLGMGVSAESLFSVCGHQPPGTAFTRQHGIHAMMPVDQFTRWVIRMMEREVVTSGSFSG